MRRGTIFFPFCPGDKTSELPALFAGHTECNEKDFTSLPTHFRWLAHYQATDKVNTWIHTLRQFSSKASRLYLWDCQSLYGHQSLQRLAVREMFHPKECISHNNFLIPIFLFMPLTHPLLTALAVSHRWDYCRILYGSIIVQGTNSEARLCGSRLNVNTS